jgi:hypothetical protein
LHDWSVPTRPAFQVFVLNFIGFLPSFFEFFVRVTLAGNGLIPSAASGVPVYDALRL